MLNYRLPWNIRVTAGMQNRLLALINIALLILFILSLLILVRDILRPGFSVRYKIPDSRLRINQTTGRSLVNFEPIVKNNPFGFSGGDLKPIDRLETLKGTGGPSSLEMRLIGTVSGGIGYAIFVNREGRQEVFKKGERIFDSGRLERVYKDKVVISEDGRTREIPLSDILTIESPKVKESGGSPFIMSSGNNTFILNQEGILHAIENPSQLMTDARLQPNYVNGKQEGFLLREVRNGGIYQSLGLQNGDILLRINNYEITNPEIALQALTALKGMDRVNLDILRNGERMTLNYQIR